MPQSLSYVPLHVVFSTKHRSSLITPDLRTELYPYLAGILQKKNCDVIQIGGMPDHVHLLFTLGRTVSIAELVRDLKSDATKWIKEKRRERSEFSWQAGYGSFGVGPRDVDMIVRYIQNQETHHKQVSFQDEFRKLLREHNIEWDERYVWD